MLKLSPERFFPVIFATTVGVLLALSTARGIGDSPEYVSVATNLSQFTRPSMNFRQREAAHLEFPQLAGADSRQDTLHFWMYPALAALPLRVTNAWHAPAPYAFVFVNIALLGTAVIVAHTRARWPLLALLFLGPVIWWIDKVHTEVFTFSLLTIGVCLWPERPVVAAIAIGTAAAQNPPLAVVLLCFAAAAAIEKPGSARRIAIAALLGTAVALIHPIYYWLRLGRFAPLADAAAIGGLTTTSFGAVVRDINIGLVPNFPWLPLAIVLVVADRIRKGLWRPTASQAASLLSICALLTTFGQLINLNHGGTPSMSRYALWIIPLTIPFLTPFPATGWAARGIQAAAVIGVVWSIAYFRPSLQEGYLVPTRTAAFVWSRYPALENPLPEIFSERLRHREAVPARAATENCAKVLLLGGEGPPDCPVEPIPSRCRAGSCYANRDGSGAYRFVVMQQRRKGPFLF